MEQFKESSCPWNDEVNIVGDMILYENFNNEKLIAIDINKLREDLLKFGDEIKRIVDDS